MIKIAPSLLAADMGNLQAQVRLVEEAGADYLHLDIMDGHFVPIISYGPAVVKTLRKESGLFFDVHLMIEKPERYLADFVAAGADLLCVHAETCPHLHRTVQNIKELGVKAAVALNPATPLGFLEDILPDLDMVLFMSVNPGFGGQKLIPQVLTKVSRLRKLAILAGWELDIQVDGGIYLDNVAQVVEAGANVLVAGSGIFGETDIGDAVRALRDAAQKANEQFWRPGQA